MSVNQIKKPARTVFIDIAMVHRDAILADHPGVWYELQGGTINVGDGLIFQCHSDIVAKGIVTKISEPGRHEKESQISYRNWWRYELDMRPKNESFLTDTCVSIYGQRRSDYFVQDNDGVERAYKI